MSLSCRKDIEYFPILQNKKHVLMSSMPKKLEAFNAFPCGIKKKIVALQ